MTDPAIPDYLTERTPATREERVEDGELFSVRVFTRHFTCPQDNVQAALGGVLAQGAPMQGAWRAGTLGGDDPTVRAVSRQLAADGGLDALSVQFIRYETFDFQYPGPDGFEPPEV